MKYCGKQKLYKNKINDLRVVGMRVLKMKKIPTVTSECGTRLALLDCWERLPLSGAHVLAGRCDTVKGGLDLVATRGPSKEATNVVISGWSVNNSTSSTASYLYATRPGSNSNSHSFQQREDINYCLWEGELSKASSVHEMSAHNLITTESTCISTERGNSDLVKLVKAVSLTDKSIIESANYFAFGEKRRRSGIATISKSSHNICHNKIDLGIIATFLRHHDGKKLLKCSREKFGSNSVKSKYKNCHETGLKPGNDMVLLKRPSGKDGINDGNCNALSYNCYYHPLS
jgi:hypothetical protein